jgi:AcrR family transcriptional regulator
MAAAEESLAAVFVEQGFDGTRMDDLARAGGVPRATLYYHFSGKSGVLAWLMGSVAEDLASTVLAACEVDGTARERLVSVVRSVVALMGRRPDACRVLIGNLEQAGRLSETAQMLAGAFHGPVAGLLVQGASDGSMRVVADPVRTASVIFGAVTIAGLQALVLEGVLDEELVGDAVVSTVIDGLAAR